MVVSVLGAVSQGQAAAAFQWAFAAAAGFSGLAVVTSLLLTGRAAPVTFEQLVEMPLPQLPAIESSEPKPVHYSIPGNVRVRGRMMSPNQKEVTTVVMRRIKPGRELEYANWFGRATDAVRKSPGFMGMTVILPGADDPGARVVLYRFADAASLEYWKRSAAMEALIPEVDEYATQVYDRAGAEGWLSLPVDIQQPGRP